MGVNCLDCRTCTIDGMLMADMMTSEPVGKFCTLKYRSSAVRTESVGSTKLGLCFVVHIR